MRAFVLWLLNRCDMQLSLPTWANSVTEFTYGKASIMAAYEQVQKGPLKLKGVAELGVTKRKKKKKDKDKAKLLEAMGTSKKNEEEKRRGLDKQPRPRRPSRRCRRSGKWKGS
ncbi:Protein FAM32A [Vulpes lagopus]